MPKSFIQRFPIYFAIFQISDRSLMTAEQTERGFVTYWHQINECRGH